MDRERKRGREGDQLLLVPYPRVIDSGANWVPYGSALKTTLYRYVLPACYTYVHTYVVHDASPFHVAAVPLAGNCRGDRSPLAAVHRTAARRFKWVAQTAPARVLCARARRNWFKPHYTRGHVREGRENNVYDERLSHRNRENRSASKFRFYFQLQFSHVYGF